MTMRAELGSDYLLRLLEVGRGLVSKHDPEAVLEQVIEAARELTGRGTRRSASSTTTSASWHAF